jgi:exonuclease SbcD
VPAVLTRILSDLHYGDRATRLRDCAQLWPLIGGVGHLVLNGDTLDTRPGPDPRQTRAQRTEVLEFFHANVPRVTFLTGNHDPDLSPCHALELADGCVFVTHGDILFDDIVPWSRDAPIIAPLIAAGLAALPPDSRNQLEPRLALWRRVAASIPQRHQSETHGLKYAIGFAADTIWPPLRPLRVLRTWHREPRLATAFVRHHRPHAKFLLLGHTHRAAVWRRPEGVTVINTGAFCPPFRSLAVDLFADRLSVRNITQRGDRFFPEGTLAEFPLA